MVGKERTLLFITVITIAGLAAGYVLSGTPLTVSVDGHVTPIRTHRSTVGELLADMGIMVLAQDSVSHPLASPLTAGERITIRRARHVTVVADGRTTEVDTLSPTADDVLAEVGVHLGMHDLILVNGQPAGPSTPLAGLSAPVMAGASLASFTGSGRRANAVFDERPSPVTISLRRAIRLEVVQGDVSQVVETAARLVGEALFNEGIYVYAADIVTPPLEAPVSPGMRIVIRRAKPVTITADGRTFTTRTQAATVAAMLTEEGVAPQGKDYSIPDLQTPITAGMTVKVTRVREEFITESSSIPFNTTYQPDDGMELDQQRVVTPGKPGVRKRTTRVVYEDGQRVQSVLDREWIDEEPTTQVIAYGTRVVVRTLNTPDGPIEYWRAIRVWTTYYTAATSGKSRDHPAYGITRTGRVATKGIVAVDPRYIRLHTNMYIPGYGFAAAEDTGGLILGRHIDLAFDEDDPHPYNLGWVTVYLLTPVPADIPWVMADFPQERR